MRLPTIRVTAAVLLLAVALAATAASVQAQEHPKQATFEAEGSQAPAALTASELLKKGTVSLTTGRFADAISHFDAAIELEPENYLSYYRRATASLSLGRSSSALSDFDRILKLNPKFSQAHFQRAKLLAREGELAGASESIKEYLKTKKDDEEAKALQKTIEDARANLKALRKAKESVDKSIAAGKPSSSVSGKLDDCMRYASLIVDASPSLLEARRARADCALFKGDVQDAMADWTRIAHLSPSPPLLLRLSALSYYIFGERSSQGRDAGLAHLKTCLNSDPDNKACAKAHRRVRALEKSLKKATNFAEASSWRAALSALKGAKVGGPTVMDDVTTAIQEGLKPAKDGEESVIPSTLHDAVKRSALLFELNEVHCRAHMELGEIKKAMPYCTKVLERDEDNKFARVARGEEHMAADRLEEAVRDLRKAFELSGNSDASIHARLQKAEKRLKLSKSKDYYKVLGVARDADDKTMKKAYRAKAREHHPDKGGSPEKMAEINEAFDVLKDKEKRARFDAGDDPNDPMGGHPGGQGNPFAQGFDPRHQFFQGGGANFFQSSGQRFEFKFG